MKRIKNIVGKILLFSMMLFVTHDYLVGQQDIDRQDRTLTTVCHVSDDAKAHTLCVEHQVFHAPALKAEGSVALYDAKASRHEFVLPTLLSQLYPFLFQTPPKTA